MENKTEGPWVNKPILIGIQIGLPKIIKDSPPLGRKGPWETGFYKYPVAGPLWLGRINLEGDGQADLKNHGGADKALNLYPAEHYAPWREELGLPDLNPGALGENFTTKGLTEEMVCIGDIYAVGGARIQISQPRQPCWKIDRRWGVEGFARRVQESGRTGWYFRVLQEGMVEAGLPLELLERPCPEWTVARANDVMHGRLTDHAALEELSRCPLLSQSWRDPLAARRGDDPDRVRKRLEGA